MEAPAAAATQDKPADETAPDSTTIEISLSPATLAALGVPADQLNAETLLSAIDGLAAKAKAADDLTAKLSTATARVAELEGAEMERGNAEFSNQVGDYDLDEDTVNLLREMDPAKREKLLGKMPKKAAAAAPGNEPGKEGGSSSASAASSTSSMPGEPPKPTHTKGGDEETDAAGEEEIAAQARDLANAAVRANPKLNFTTEFDKAVKKLTP